MRCCASQEATDVGFSPLAARVILFCIRFLRNCLAV
jgi:hypothetical protein